MNEAKQRYLIRMTTLRGCFYMCGNLVEGICGWTTSDQHIQVTRYQMLHAAKRQAQLKWQDLNKVFEVLAIDVITPMGETVWTADSCGTAVNDEQVTLHDLRIMHEHALKTNEALRERADLVDPLQERCELLGRALAAIWPLVDEEYQREIVTLLDAPCGPGETMPANVLMRILARKDATPRAEADA